MKRSRPAGDDLHVAVGAGQDRLMHGGHRGVPGGIRFLEPGEEFQRIEAGRADHRRARRDAGQGGGDQPVDVKQRHDVEADIAGRQRQACGRCDRPRR